MIRIFALAWILGIASVGLLPLSVLDQSFWWVVTGISLLVLLLLWKIKIKQNWIGFRLILTLCSTIGIFAIAHQYVESQLTDRLSQQVQKREKIDGVVYIQTLSEGKLNEQRQQAVLLLPLQNKTLNLLLYPKRNYNQKDEISSLTFGEHAEFLKLGHYYQVTLDLKPPHSFANAGSFDQERWLLQQNIAATATVLYQKELSIAEIQKKGWGYFVAQQNQFLAKWKLNIEKMRLEYRQALLDHQQFSSLQSRALLLGLLTGDRSGLNKNTTELYQIMGISHLLAISGPHVLILATLVTSLIMWLSHFLMRKGYGVSTYRYISKSYLYIPIFLFFVSFYTAFTGFEIPAVRTWIMVSLCSVALLLKLRVSSLTLLLSTACVVLLWDSFSILSSAFWLSFCASAILIYVYRDMQKYMENEYTHEYVEQYSVLKNYFHLLWQSQWRISLVLIPIVLWQFQAVSLISVVINLIAIPLLSVIIVPLNIISAIIYQFFPSLAQLLWSLLANIVAIFHFVLELIRPIAEKLYLVSYLTPIALMSLTIALIIFMLPKGLIAKYWSVPFLILPCITPQRALLNFDILDVGQGQATVLRTKNHQMLIDTGMGAWQNGQLSMGDRVVIPFLRQNGIRELDEILLSHLDFDHSGGTESIVQAMPVKQIRSNDYDGRKTNYAHIPYMQCHQGQNWQWDQVKISILYPREKQPRYDANETSCVVLIETQQYNNKSFKILIMGDVGWEGEYYLLQDYPHLTADILVLGHHGSKYSSAYDFLQQINPQLAVISAGYDNRYGHPAPETLARLNDLNIAYVNTAEVGAVNIQLKHHNALWQWSSYRRSKRWLMPKQNHIQLDSTQN